MKRLAALIGTIVLLFFVAPAFIAEAHDSTVGICHWVSKNNYVYKVVDPDGIHADHKNDVFNVADASVCENATTPIATGSNESIVVVPIEPSRVPNTCTDDEHLVLPNTEGIDYVYISVNVVRATPQDGYSFRGDQEVVFKFDLKKAGEELDCPSPLPSESPLNPSPAASPPTDVYACNDFATQTDAQKVYDMYFKDFGDFAHLDTNKDGIACNETVATPTETQKTDILPSTGNSAKWWIIGGFGAVIVGIGALLSKYFLRNRTKS